MNLVDNLKGRLMKSLGFLTRPNILAEPSALYQHHWADESGEVTPSEVVSYIQDEKASWIEPEHLKEADAEKLAYKIACERVLRIAPLQRIATVESAKQLIAIEMEYRTRIMAHSIIRAAKLPLSRELAATLGTDRN